MDSPIAAFWSWPAGEKTEKDVPGPVGNWVDVKDGTLFRLLSHKTCLLNSTTQLPWPMSVPSRFPKLVASDSSSVLVLSLVRTTPTFSTVISLKLRKSPSANPVLTTRFARS